MNSSFFTLCELNWIVFMAIVKPFRVKMRLASFCCVNLILGFHMTSRPPCWCPKQRKGGHVGAPTKSSGNLTLLLCKSFLLFSLKNMAVDHVSENQQLNIPCLVY